MEATFYQARSGRIYMRYEFSEVHICEVDLIESQVTKLLPVLMDNIDFSNKEQFDLNQYQCAYGQIAAEILYSRLSEIYGIKPESLMKQQEDKFRCAMGEIITASAADNINLTDLNLSTRAYNILSGKHTPLLKNKTAADALVNIPSLSDKRNCGIQTITEITNAFYKAGIPCKHWINEVREEKYFIENFIGELEEES